MPYVDFPSEPVRIWYRTNLIDDDIRDLDPRKPTVVLLHGAVTDSTFLDLQFYDPRFKSRFNMLGFDSRSAGRTINGYDPSRDTWTEAADIAKALIILGVPPCHIFASGIIAHRAAIHLASLWPDLCLSISWIGTRVDKEPEWVAEAYREVMKVIFEADDIEAIEEAANELIYYIFGDRMSEENQDRFAAYLATQYAGSNSPRLYDYHMMVLDRAGLEAKELRLIEQPVLVIQAKDSNAYGAERVFPLEDQLVHAALVEVHVVDGPTQVHAIPPYANTVNDLFLNFIERIGHSANSRRGDIPPLRDAMTAGLARLALLCDSDAMEAGDPLLSASFSRLPLAQRQQRATMLGALQKAAAGRSTSGIVGADGQPIRRFSERHLSNTMKPTVVGPTAGLVFSEVISTSTVLVQE